MQVFICMGVKRKNATARQKKSPFSLLTVNKGILACIHFFQTACKATCIRFITSFINQLLKAMPRLHGNLKKGETKMKVLLAVDDSVCSPQAVNYVVSESGFIKDDSAIQVVTV